MYLKRREVHIQIIEKKSTRSSGRLFQLINYEQSINFSCAFTKNVRFTETIVFILLNWTREYYICIIIIKSNSVYSEIKIYCFNFNLMKNFQIP